jgi:histidyl-tRNA synthetase
MTDARTTPRTPPGVLELLPAEQAIHDSMLDVIRSGCRRFGFAAIETPAIERSEVLLTKTGGETERQVYFVQSAGAVDQEGDPELALRFDLTVPLARYVAEHEHSLVFPFRRSQVQRVYRGERPQRGRYREFYQCDIDVIDRDALSLRHDAEVAATMVSILDELGIGPFTVRLNNRRLMRSLLSSRGVVEAGAQTDVLRELDKLERAGAEAVARRLTDLTGEVETAGGLLDLARTRVHGRTAIEDELGRLSQHLSDDTGARELAEVVATLDAFDVPADRYALDLSIARGLDYYTGTVYETTLDDHPELGSICSGGRYDDLAGRYTSTRLPGVGLSIGFTRLFWQLREAGLLPGGVAPVEVVVTLIDDGLDYALGVARRLRGAGMSVETALEPAKLGKQLKSADRAGIRFAVIAGEDERGTDTVTVRDLRTGEQATVALGQVVEHIDNSRREDSR